MTDRWIAPGSRIMDLAWMRDGRTVYTGEALVLACLLHAKGKTRRGQAEVEQVAKMMRDPNLNRKKPTQRKK
jgi:hypothetical protein